MKYCPCPCCRRVRDYASGLLLQSCFITSPGSNGQNARRTLAQAACKADHGCCASFFSVALGRAQCVKLSQQSQVQSQKTAAYTWSMSVADLDIAVADILVQAATAVGCGPVPIELVAGQRRDTLRTLATMENNYGPQTQRSGIQTSTRKAF